MKRLLLTCNATQARLFQVGKRHEPLRRIVEMKSEHGRLRTQDLVTDKPGRIFKGRSGILTALDPRTNPHQIEMERFAEQIADMLQNEVDGEHLTLTIAAPPHFLGLLRARLTPEVDDRIQSALTIDLVHVEDRDLPRHVDYALWPGC